MIHCACHGWTIQFLMAAMVKGKPFLVFIEIMPQWKSKADIVTAFGFDLNSRIIDL